MFLLCLLFSVLFSFLFELAIALRFRAAGGQSTLNISIDESPPASVCRRGQLSVTHHFIMCDVLKWSLSLGLHLLDV